MTTDPSIASTAAEAAGDALGYLRHPTLHGDHVAFVCDDDLWTAPVQGGAARRLTAGLSEPSTPCYSPDGRSLAFVGRDEQHPEVCVMPAEGGPARRLTWLGTDTLVRGWTGDGRIVFVTTQGQPFFRNHHAFTIDPAGGVAEPLPWGQVNHIAFGPGGATVIGRNTADPARWKRYRGGTAGHFWIDVDGSGDYRRMKELEGNLTSPMWIGERLYFLSDDEGVGNLYSCRPDGSQRRRHTDHASFYARHAQSDGKRIVYQCAASLWLFDPATDTTRELDIRTPAHRAQAARRFVPASDHLESFRAHPAGHSVALVARGQLFTMAHWEGAVRRLAEADGGRLRHGQWLGDGTGVVAVGDASGEERVVVFAGGTARRIDVDTGHVTALRAAPSGTRIALANHRNEVWVGDVGEGEDLRLVDRSDFGRATDLAWSSDGAWLAYSSATSTRHTAIKLLEVASGTSTLVTRPEFRDWSPAFDPDGRYLAFLSARTFDPVYDSVQFELSFPRGARPYLIALQAGGRPPFDPEPRGFKSDGDGMDGGAAAADGAPVRVDLDGIASRVAAFPVTENRFGRIAPAAGGKVLWTVLSIVGAHGRGGHKEECGRLEVFDFSTLRVETLVDKVDDFDLAADGTTVVVRDGKRLRALAVRSAGARKSDTSPAPAPTSDGPPSRKSGWLDLERPRVSIEPRREWRQMLLEVWRLQRDQFWSEAMSGVDWPAVYAMYAPLVGRVATRAELSDLIWEMQGELGTSHAYEMGGDHRKPPAVALGYLGAETRFDPVDRSWEITRIVGGDPWDATADSPLNAIGVEAKVGERIVAVGGQRLSASAPPQALLVHQAGSKVELTLKADATTDAPTREVVVTTLADEVPARYREWVEINRAWVHAQTQGRVGYLHLPDMQAAGYAEFHRYFAGECDRDALVIDVRYNRGGHVSQLLLEKVARRRIAYTLSRWSKPTSYPDEAVAGPVVALTNEHAGSDGDIFSHCFKLMKLGPLVGTRTWGGVVGIWPRHTLVDGTQTTQPEYAFWFSDVGWAVENYGTDPDIEVDNAPQDAAAGRDRQLEVAVKSALERAGAAAKTERDYGARPVLARKTIPPR